MHEDTLQRNRDSFKPVYQVEKPRIIKKTKKVNKENKNEIRDYIFHDVAPTAGETQPQPLRESWRQPAGIPT